MAMSQRDDTIEENRWLGAVPEHAGIHGDDEFTHFDVASMIRGTTDFIAKYMG